MVELSVVCKRNATMKGFWHEVKVSKAYFAFAGHASAHSTCLSMESYQSVVLPASLPFTIEAGWSDGSAFSLEHAVIIKMLSEWFARNSCCPWQREGMMQTTFAE